MPLVSLNDVSIRFRGPELLSDVTCRIDENQRIGLLGRNGAGKSTLMKLVTGEVEPDSGNVSIENGVVVRQLAQEVPQSMEGSIREVVELGHEPGQEDEATRCLCVVQESVFDALQAAVRDCKNFKVRINAGLSLSMPTERATYRSPRAYSQVRVPTERATYRSLSAYSQVRVPTKRATYRSPRAYSQVRVPTKRATYRSPRAYSQ